VPVSVLDKTGLEIPGYSLLQITGRAGPIDDSRSQMVWCEPERPVGDRYPAWVGLYFALDSWDGSDLFVPAHSGFVIVTERVKAAFEDEGITNVSLTPLLEVKRLML
jgi:hypothetical protein